MTMKPIRKDKLRKNKDDLTDLLDKKPMQTEVSIIASRVYEFSTRVDNLLAKFNLTRLDKKITKDIATLDKTVLKAFSTGNEILETKKCNRKPIKISKDLLKLVRDKTVKMSRDDALNKTVAELATKEFDNAVTALEKIDILYKIKLYINLKLRDYEGAAKALASQINAKQNQASCYKNLFDAFEKAKDPATADVMLQKNVEVLDDVLLRLCKEDKSIWAYKPTSVVDFTKNNSDKETLKELIAVEKLLNKLKK